MLDRERAYFTLSVNPEGICFKQDGKFFYRDGKPVIEEEKEIKKAAPKKRGRKPAKKD